MHCIYKAENERGIFIMKKMVALGLAFALCFAACGCAPKTAARETPQMPESLHRQKPTAAEKEGYFYVEDILDDFDITSLSQIKYASENTAYAIGFESKSPLDLPNPECVLIRLNTETKEAKVIYREYLSADDIWNMTVERIDETTDIIAIGSELLYVSLDRVEPVIIDEKYREYNNYNAKTMQLAYNDDEALWLYNIKSGTNTQIAKKSKNTEGELISIPHNPRISPDGKHLMFQYIGSHGANQKIVITSAEGEVIFETAENKDSMDAHYFWLSDGFVLTAPDYDNGGTIFKVYDMEGNLLKTLSYNFGLAGSIFSIDEEHHLQAFTYSEVDKNGELIWLLAVVDFKNGTAVKINTGISAVNSVDISPSGEKVIGVTNRGTGENPIQYIFEARLAEIETEPIENRG